MTTMLEILAVLGRATWEPIWVPFLAWTVFALPLSALLTKTSFLHPYAEYRLWQMLLATLPLSLLGVLVIDAWWTTPIPVDSGLSVFVLPPIKTSGGSVPADPEVGWSHVVGTLTLGALLMSAVSLSHLVVNAVAVARVRSRVENSALPEETQSTVDRLTNVFGLNRPVQVRVSRHTVVPVTIGGLHPLVLLPPTLVDQPEALRMTLAHEFVHIRRYDDVAHVVERILAAICAAHPLVGRIIDRIAEVREQACDAAVLTDGQTSASSYARLLATFAEEPSPQRVGALTLSEAPSSLTNRLNAMKSVFPRWLSSPVSLIVSLLTLGLFVTLGVVACSDSIAPNPPDQSVNSKSSATGESSDEIFVVVDQQPDCGGIQALSEHIQYPEIAREAGIEGRVFVQFIVDENGKVVEPTVTRGVHEALDQAALAAVRELECKPGEQRGEPVKVKMALPVTFQLPSEGTSAGTSRNGNVHVSSTPGNGPQIEGGMEALREQLFYPELVRDAGIEGTVHVTFTVDESGTARNVRVSKSVHDDLDAAARKAIQSVSFTPPETNGSEEITLPVTFRLPEDENGV